MSTATPSTGFAPLRLASASGLSVEINANGSIRRMDHGDIILNLFLGNEAEGGPANLYLRRLGETVEAVPLLGPRSPARVHYDGLSLALTGAWGDIGFRVMLTLAGDQAAWFWHVELENHGEAAAELDLIYAQDLALAHYGAVRLNEYYVSQYLDNAPLNHPERGTLLACRQNQSMGGSNPWCLIGSLGKGVSFATDALQLYGLAARAGAQPEGVMQGLPGVRRQHEHAMAAIQDEALCLQSGQKAARGFFGFYLPHHPEATSTADLACVEAILALPEAQAGHDAPLSEGQAPAPSLFACAPLLDALELSEADVSALFGAGRREEETEDGQLLSFFCGERSHVVLKAKEGQVLRPHGQILRSGNSLTPDEAGLTSTAWMAGVFHSMVTQGHVSINRFLSTTHSYLGLFRSHGLRVFADLDGAWRLLDVPSAFEMSPEACRWHYQHAGGLIRVESRAGTDRHELGLSVDVLLGRPCRFLVSLHVAINGDDGAAARPVQCRREGQGIFVGPVADCDVGWRFPQGGFRLTPSFATPIERVGTDDMLFTDGATRDQPYLCLLTAAARNIGLTITGHLVSGTPLAAQTPDDYWRQVSAGLRVAPQEGSDGARGAARLGEILPWLAQNALVHYLSPRGLEQYSGGGWGTRDVCQGPVEMLLALGRPEPVRDLLLRVFKQQNPDGDWPQWFMFFDRERNIRPSDSHGDIVFWPVLALAQYLIASGDGSLLDEELPFFDGEGEAQAERASIRQHVERALALMARRRIPDTQLAAYGHGDWNDSLQPADPAMRERLCSAWTVTLHYQTLTALAEASRRLALHEPAEHYAALAAQVKADFQRLLIVDGVLTGFAYFKQDGAIDYLLHPRDQATGLSYSLLAMIHAVINGLFTPEQAAQHFDLIGQHLTGQDGARLFDRPMAYHGGPQTYFQRAESSSFFGREIGLMYTHAHLRYVESLWCYGDAQGFYAALCKANPIALRELVPAASPRQANCYYSSSDAAFADRYEAYADYTKALRGEVPLEGGWRVYSSGAGISMSLILRCFLGLRREHGRMLFDPVMPAELDGLRAELSLEGRACEVTYRIKGSGCGPVAVEVNGAELPFMRGENPYRVGAAEVPLDAFRDALREGLNRLTVHLGAEVAARKAAPAKPKPAQEAETKEAPAAAAPEQPEATAAEAESQPAKAGAVKKAVPKRETQKKPAPKKAAVEPAEPAKSRKSPAPRNGRRGGKPKADKP
ncbi:GH36-type glycosyl hydrolase domain-containing protein [Methyloterricola oryzae]|uniref:GH36-type glycosyl hydrolase domain-containing protein n=1 Tax=Methyloterricola oryzae TaxID=1495050 RepID=UPI000B1D4AE2|nr:hypothetical protein [Methyloterricola oryzae]